MGAWLADRGNFDLTDHARQKVRCSNPPCGPPVHAMDNFPKHVERAIHAHYRGPAAQNRRELRRVYNLLVVCVPANRPVIRTQFNWEVAFRSTLW